jgi:hypothetical protein
MPSFVSKGGIWEPAIEETVVKKVQPDGSIKHELYHGPDREAEKYIADNGGVVGILNVDDPQIIEIAENKRMKVQEYIERFGPKPEQIKAKEIADKEVVTHATVKGKKGVQPSDGGFGSHTDLLKRL